MKQNFKPIVSGTISDVTEAVHSPALTGDRERGVIIGVRVATLKSRNGYEYTAEAVRAAVPMYEGRVVNIDHTSKPGGDRSSRDRFGRLVNAKYIDEGITADLEYLKTHPMAGMVTEAAERMPEVFGLSHEARVKWRTPAKSVAESILNVRSVDVVANPATCSSLQESDRRKTVATTVREYAKTLKAGSKVGKLFGLVCEMEGMGEMPMEAPASSAAIDPDQALKDGIVAAMRAALDMFSTGDMDSAAMVLKIKDLAKTFDKAAGAGAAAAEEPAEEEAAAESKKKAKPSSDPLVADLQEQLKALQRKDQARQLCDAEAVKPSAVLLKALGRCADEAEMKELIQESKAAQASTGDAPRAKPKSGHQGGAVQESKNAKAPATLDEFARETFGRPLAVSKN